MGELPWNQATLDISDYQNWKDGEIERSAHWQRLQDNLLLSLIKKILAHSPSKRYTILQIRNHLWVKKKFKDSDGCLFEPELLEPTSPPSKALKPYDDNSHHFERLCASQPARVFTNNLTRMPSVTQAQFQRLVKRMTRFWVKNSLEETDRYLPGLLQKLNYTFRCKPKGVFTIQTQDRRGAPLTFRCTLIQVDLQILVDFRLSKGCGIEFKRHFAKLKTNCASIIEKGPTTFPSLIACNA